MFNFLLYKNNILFKNIENNLSNFLNQIGINQRLTQNIKKTIQVIYYILIINYYKMFILERSYTIFCSKT